MSAAENLAGVLAEIPLYRVHQQVYDRVLVDLDSEVIRQVTRGWLGGRPAGASRSRLEVAASRTLPGWRGRRPKRFDVWVASRSSFRPWGATAARRPKARLEVVGSLRVTEAFVRCPILSSMDVVQLGSTDDGMPVYLDRNAASADGIIVINR